MGSCQSSSVPTVTVKSPECSHHPRHGSNSQQRTKDEEKTFPKGKENSIQEKYLSKDEVALSYSANDEPARATKGDHHASSPRTHTSVFHVQYSSSQGDTSRPEFQTSGVQNQTSSEHVQESISHAPDNSQQILGNSHTSQTSRFSILTNSSTPMADNQEAVTNSSEAQISSPHIETSNHDHETSMRLTSQQAQTDSSAAHTNNLKTETNILQFQADSSATQRQDLHNPLDSTDTNTNSQTRTDNLENQTSNLQAQTDSSETQTGNLKDQLENPETQSINAKAQTDSSESQTCNLQVQTDNSDREESSAQANTNSSESQTCNLQVQTDNSDREESSAQANTNSSESQTCNLHVQTDNSDREESSAHANTNSPESQTSMSQIPTDSSEISKTSTTAGTSQEKLQTQEQKISKKELLNEFKKALLETVGEISKELADRGITPYTNNQANTIRQAIAGDIDMVCPSAMKIVRIFTSSTFTDTKNERNMLMKHAYPKLKEYCRNIGYEFQVVDMRWGVRDEATNDHMGTELCLKELKLCQEVSTGPNFISFLSHKYGYTPFPRVIDATEFDMIMEGMEEENRHLFKRWYTRDDNAVPPAYVLCPISTHLPGFISQDPELKKSAKQSWWEESETIQAALDVTATKALNKEMARKYIMSVTEAEVQEGLLKTENSSKHILWFRRNIEDIEDLPSSHLLSRFIECTGLEEKWKKAREMLRELKEEQMVKKLSPSRIISYNVPWNEASGINPDDERHKEYLESLCVDFVKSMKVMIDTAVAERGEMSEELIEEYMRHIRFCQAKCEGFQGREDTLELIKQYVQGTSTEPLVIHGPSGTGKSSIMAMAAKMIKKWTSAPPLLVLRFIGISPDSSSIIRLIESITYQICLYYQINISPPVQTMHANITRLRAVLSKGSQEKPLIVMLDALDQLDPAYNARKLTWLVKQLVPGTKIIVSTLPEPMFECFPALQAQIKTVSNFIDVPALQNYDVKTILEGWLASKNRCLTDQQMDIVLNAFTKCPTPMFLKLSFEEASRWTSFSPLEMTVLKDTVEASIDFLFQRLERAHGEMLVSRALSYMTMARNGASEAELEDILSCDDDVLNDVYMYWTPPIRRLPPLLLVRIRTDISQYLVERGADGVQVLYWYHQCFTEAAFVRYYRNKETVRRIHEGLADFFSGTWAGGKKKPYTSPKGEKGEEDRHVSMQPLKFGEKKFNMRTLNNLPYHRIKAGQVDLLIDQCLANPEFLFTKMAVAQFNSVYADIIKAKNAFPEDMFIGQIFQVFSLSQKGLSTDIYQLIPQLLQRLKETEYTKALLQRWHDYPHTYMLPTKHLLEQPGGQLVNNISAHGSDIDWIDLTADGKLAITVSQSEKMVKIWDVEDAMEKRVAKVIGQCTKAVFCNNDKWIAFEAEKRIIVQDVDIGNNIKVLASAGDPSSATFCTCAKGKRYIMQFLKQLCCLTDLLAVQPPSEKFRPFQHPEKIEFGSMSIPAGSENYIAVCSNDQYFITVFDLASCEYKPKFRGFVKESVGDDLGELEDHKVEALAIFPDETHLVYTSSFASEVVFADFDGNRLKSISGDTDRNFRSVSFIPSGEFMYLHSGNELFIYNTQTLHEVDCMKQYKSINGVRSNDMNMVLTVSEDGNLRIFDRSREEEKNEEFNFTTLYSFKFTLNLNNPRYVLIGGNVSKDSRTLRLEIYDVFTEKVVRRCEMPELGDLNVEALRTSNPNHVILSIEKCQLVKIDISTMTLIHEYEGFTTSFALAEDTQELFCTTQTGDHVKVYNESGNVSAVIEADQNQKITDVTVNVTGSTGCFATVKGPLMLYDLTKRTHTYSIEQGEYGENFAAYKYINRAGTRLLFYSDGKISSDPILDIGHLVLWDIINGKELRRMFDQEMERKRRQYKSPCVSNLMGEVLELDNDKVITGHYDNIMRVWNTESGTLLHRFHGHKTCVKIILSPDCPYILSYGSDLEEDCLKLWDRKTYKLEASFSLDETVNHVAWSQDGKFFISNKNLNPPDLAMWKVHHGFDHMTVNEEDYPETFSTTLDFSPIIVEVIEKKDQFEEVDFDSDHEETTGKKENEENVENIENETKAPVVLY